MCVLAGANLASNIKKNIYIDLRLATPHVIL